MSPDAWTFLVLDRTQRLARTDAFRSLHRRIVAALEEVGEVGTLSGREFERIAASARGSNRAPLSQPRQA